MTELNPNNIYIPRAATAKPSRVKFTLWVLGLCAAVPLAMWAANAIYQANKQ